MKLAANNRLVRWAYWFDERPDRTSICVLFWRSIIAAPLVALLAVSSIAIWGPILLWEKYGEKPYLAWVARREQAEYDRWVASCKKRLNNPPDPSALKILWLGLLSIKRKFCPIVDFY